MSNCTASSSLSLVCDIRCVHESAALLPLTALPGHRPISCAVVDTGEGESLGDGCASRSAAL